MAKRDSPIVEQHFQINVQEETRPQKTVKRFIPSETIAHIKMHLQRAHMQALKFLHSELVSSAASEIMEAINQLPRLQEEIDALRQDLEDRKITERAKGILMKRADLTEAEAHKRLQKQSVRRKMKMVDVAKIIIDAESIMKGFDSEDGEAEGLRNHQPVTPES